MNTLFGPLPAGDVSACLMGIFSGSQTGSCSWVPQGVLVVAPALVAILKYLSYGCTVVGAFLFATWGTQKVLVTNHAGGQALAHWDMVLMPVRLVLAAGLLLPYPNGLSGIEDLTIYLAGSGIYLGDRGWSKASQIIDSGSYKIVPTIPPGVNALSISLLKSLTCMDIENSLTPGNISIQQKQIGGAGQSAANYFVIAFGASPNAQGIAGDMCGTYSVPVGSGSVVQSGTDPWSASQPPNVTKVTQAQAQAMSQMLKSLSPIAQAITQNLVNPQGTPGSGQRARCFENNDTNCLTTNTQLPDMSVASQNPAGKGQFVGAMTQIQRQYEATILQATENYGNVGHFTKPEFGWFLAGDAFRNLMIHTKALIGAAYSTPTPAMSIDTAGSGSEVQKGLTAVDFYVKNYGTSSAPQNVGQAIGTPSQCDAKNIPEKAQVGCKILSLLSANRYSGNPITGIVQIGMGLEDIGLLMMGGGALAGAIDSTLGSASMSAGEAVFIPGVLIGEWLPVVVSLIWLYFVVGWFALLIEALVAGPLFAVAHLDPGGPGFAGASAITGYRLLLGVCLRPILGLAGLLGGMMVSKIAVYLGIALWFDTANVGVQGGVIHETITQISLAVFFAVGIFYAVLKSMELITYVPESVMRWIAGPTNSMGEHGMIGQVRQFWGEKLKEFSSAGRRGAEGVGRSINKGVK